MRRSPTIVLVIVLILSSLAFVAPLGVADWPPPSADAGDDQTVQVGDSVTLDGSGSRDLNADDTLTFAFKHIQTNPNKYIKAY